MRTRVVLIILACIVVGCAQSALPAPAVPSPEPLPSGETADIAGYCAALRNSSDPFFGTQQRERLAAELENPTFPTLSWRVSIMRELARDYLRFGEAAEAIRLLSDALETELREKPEVSHEAELLHELAIASMKMGELDNCVSPDGRLICALPLDDSLVHQDKRGASGAVEYLTRLLELEPENISAMWLLNVAHMALGTYPEGVPDEFRVPEDALQSEYDIGRFEEIAPYAGLYAVNTAGGSVIEDFDNDGLLDVMVSTWDPCKPIAYYRNEGRRRFRGLYGEGGTGGAAGRAEHHAG